MRVRLALCVLGLLMFCPGCGLIDTGANLVLFEAKDCLDEHAERVRNRHWAEAAWDKARNAAPGGCFSADYGQGFKDGFTDYLFEGGSGEPPALPPQNYRTIAYQTPAGYRAIEDWFAGYRHGTAIARTDGYRQWVTGPSSLRRPELGDPNSGLLEPTPQGKTDNELLSLEQTPFEARASATLPVAESKTIPASAKTDFCPTSRKHYSADQRQGLGTHEE
jgi:hypothetical protein